MASNDELCASQSMKLAGESEKVFMPAKVVCGGVCQSFMMRSASGNGSGRSTTASTTVKMAELTPMPRPRMRMPASANPGLRVSVRSAVAQIARERLEHREAAAIAIRLLRALETPQRDHRAAAGFVRGHPGAQVVVDVQLQMAVELRGELVLGAPPGERAGQSVDPGSDGFHRSVLLTTKRSQRIGEPRAHVSNPHHSSLGARKRVMIAEVASHWRVSRSICFRPAFVSR